MLTPRTVSLLLAVVLWSLLSADALTNSQLRATTAPFAPPYPHPDITFDPATHLHTFSTRAPTAASCDTRYASWMSDNLPLLSNLTLLSLPLPGSHDSGAYALTTDLGPISTGSAFWDAVIELEAKLGLPVAAVLMPWSLSQPVDVAGQLCMGARYLDVRAAWNGSHWRVYHGLLGVTVAEVLEDVAHFVNQQKDEVVVVEVSHLQAVAGVNITAAAVAQLNATIADTFGELLYSPSTPSFVLHTIGELIAMNQRVIVSLSSSDLPWPLDRLSLVTPFDSSALFNTYADTPDLATMQRYDLLTLISYLLPTPAQLVVPLRKLSYTLTPDGNTLLDWWIPGQPKSLKDLAEQANNVLSSDSSLGGWRRDGLFSVGGGAVIGGSSVIVLMDWFETRLVDECIWALRGFHSSFPPALEHNRIVGEAATVVALR